MQRRVIKQVLHEAQFEIERARLEDDAETAQRLARRLGDIIAHDLDGAGSRRVEPGREREERALARAVEAKQHGEGAALDF